MQRPSVYLATAAIGCLALVSPVVAEDNVVGAEAYRTSCAVCHGASGQGDGEFASLLTIRPPNLTLLSSKNDGVFPYLDVFRMIDGRTIDAHGRVMPIWGDTFERAAEAVGGPYGTELLVRAQIVALVDYVETLQK